MAHNINSYHCQASLLAPEPSSTLLVSLQANFIMAITTKPVIRAVTRAVMMPTRMGLMPSPEHLGVGHSFVKGAVVYGELQTFPRG